MVSIISANQCLLVKMLITLEPYGIFGSKFAYLFILTLSNHWNAKMVSIISAGQCLLVKMLINLGIF